MEISAKNTVVPSVDESRDIVHEVYEGSAFKAANRRYRSLVLICMAANLGWCLTFLWMSGTHLAIMDIRLVGDIPLGLFLAWTQAIFPLSVAVIFTYRSRKMTKQIDDVRRKLSPVPGSAPQSEAAK